MQHMPTRVFAARVIAASQMAGAYLEDVLLSGQSWVYTWVLYLCGMTSRIPSQSSCAGRTLKSRLSFSYADSLLVQHLNTDPIGTKAQCGCVKLISVCTCTLSFPSGYRSLHLWFTLVSIWPSTCKILVRATWAAERSGYFLALSDANLKSCLSFTKIG